MLSYLKVENAGPADLLELELAPRLNLLTGDNGLGKSFLLDIAWYCLAGVWPSEINKNISSGFPTIPRNKTEESAISCHYTEGNYSGNSFQYIRNFQSWKIFKNDRIIPFEGICLYVQSDNSVSIWDSMRNGRSYNSSGFINSPQAFVFDNSETWNGQRSDEKITCNGLIQDWSSWQKEQGENFRIISSCIKILSPSNEETLVPGNLTRVTIDDVRDIPTIQTKYGEVPIIHASSGIRKILSLAYLLVWSWEEHKISCKITGNPIGKNFVFLIDELDSHLHPKWQRTIVKSLLSVMEAIAPEVKVQVIAATHSPLIMASVEPFFDPKQDAWFDLDLVDGEVKIEKRPWYRRGDADAWLKSEAFDQKSGYAPETERAIEEAKAAMANANLTYEEAKELDLRLRNLLGELDPFWISWGFFFEDKGWKK